jgi:hypothetical protein
MFSLSFGQIKTTMQSFDHDQLNGTYCQHTITDGSYVKVKGGFQKFITEESNIVYAFKFENDDFIFSGTLEIIMDGVFYVELFNKISYVLYRIEYIEIEKNKL